MSWRSSWTLRSSGIPDAVTKLPRPRNAGLAASYPNVSRTCRPGVSDVAATAWYEGRRADVGNVPHLRLVLATQARLTITARMLLDNRQSCIGRIHAAIFKTTRNRALPLIIRS